MKHIEDLFALLGLIALAAGVYVLAGPGWSLVVFGAGLYSTAILTVLVNAAIANRNSDQ